MSNANQTPAPLGGTAETDTAQTFDISQPLPTAFTSINASAGTGKTFTMVNLTIRMLAENRCTAETTVILTFARSATSELRERLLARLGQTVNVLHAFLDPTCLGHPLDEGKDPLWEKLKEGTVTEVEQRSERLLRALRNLDRVTVETLHAWAETIERTLDGARVYTTTTDIATLQRDLQSDLHLYAAGRAKEEKIRWSWRGISAFVEQGIHTGILADPEDPLGPRIKPSPLLSPDEPNSAAWFAQQAGIVGQHRLEMQGLVQHNRVVQQLASRLRDEPETAEQLAAKIDLLLVDEFQDTDPAQLQILQALANSAHTKSPTLIVVGDPKQAIYTFRGADVATYNRARKQADGQSLVKNYRTDAPLVAAVQQLFAESDFGEGITLPQIASRYHEPRMWGIPAALSLRVLDETSPEHLLPRRGKNINVSAATAAVTRDVGNRVVTLLNDPDAQILGDDGNPRRLRYDDFAVLVQTRKQATHVFEELAAKNVPVVVDAGGNVHRSPGAHDWLWVIEALERPSSSNEARKAALTSIIGWTPGELAAADNTKLAQLHVNLHEWAEVLHRDGFMCLYRHIAAATNLYSRLLGRPDGERRITDIDHLAEILHVQHDQGCSLASLRTTLQRHIAVAETQDRNVQDSTSSLKLEREGGAVRVLTVHAAKGLEFGITMVPFLWNGSRPKQDVWNYNDTDRMVIDFGSPSGKEKAAAAAAYEEMRVAYVALTRAVHHCELWWATTRNAKFSALHSLLNLQWAKDAHSVHETWHQIFPGGNVPEHADLADNHPVTPADVTLFAPADRIALEPRDSETPKPRPPQPFNREIDRIWARYSYSSIAGRQKAEVKAGRADDHDTIEYKASVGSSLSSADQTHIEDHSADYSVVVSGTNQPAMSENAERLNEVVPLDQMAGGAAIGTFVHSVLENLDFQRVMDFSSENTDASEKQSDDNKSDDNSGLVLDRGAVLDQGAHPSSLQQSRDYVRSVIAQQLQHQPGVRESIETESLIDGISAILNTPWASMGNFCLKDLSLGSRIDEMAYEMPLAPTGHLRVHELGDIWQQTVPTSDPLAPYGDVLKSLFTDVQVGGYLEGLLDLTIRLDTGKWVVADYKTNRLGPQGQPLCYSAYTQPMMTQAMLHDHYPLQALLYSVALHRYLRWRLKGYDINTHFGGVAYLFVRGMGGANTPVVDGTTCGVFTWMPPLELVTAVDARIAGSVHE